MTAETNGATGDDSSSKVDYNPLVPKLVIELDGERGEFLGFDSPNQWAMMQNAKAGKEGPQAQMAAMYQLAVTSVKPEDRERFEEFMSEHGQDEDLLEVLGESLNKLWSGETRLPLVPTSSDSSTSTSESEPTSTGDSWELASDLAPAPVADATIAADGSSTQDSIW
jgi:hypothetical protein